MGKRDLSDTPFSRDRLLLWAVGIALVYSVVMIGLLSYQGKDVPRPIQSVAMYCLGVASAYVGSRKDS